MILQLLPNQVSEMWETIKFTLVQANQVPPEQVQEFTNEALVHLLSGKFQAWILFDFTESLDKDIRAIGVTSLVDDKMFGYKYLSLDTIFAFQKLSDEFAKKCMDQLAEFAKAAGCKKMIVRSAHPRIWELSGVTGYTEIGRIFSRNI